MNQDLVRQLRYYWTLIAVLAIRDLTERYRDTIFGFLWAVLRPTMFMLVFSVLKGISNLPSDGLPYPVFSFTGVALWLAFTAAVSIGTPTLTKNAGIIKKIPVPRILFPISGMALAASEFVFAMVPLAVLLVIFQIVPTWHIVFVIPILIITLMVAFSLTLLIATVSVFKNDFMLALPYILMAGLFLSPILYPFSAVPEQYHTLYLLNPMVGPLEGIRSAILLHEVPDWSMFGSSTIFACVVLPISVLIFNKISKHFADLL